MAASVKDRGLKALLRAVFRDKAFFERFSQCPASQSYHHAYLGGLIEHTVAVAGTVRDCLGAATTESTGTCW